MSAAIPTRCPLHWPAGWKRTEPHQRRDANFKRHGQALTVAQGSERVLESLQRLGIHPDDVIVSTNLLTRLDGMPRSGQPRPVDPGAAVYWQGKTGPMRSMAVDAYTEVADNLAAIAATLEAFRTIERHGGAVILDRAFAGFALLPAPDHGTTWRGVLGYEPGATPSAEDLRVAYRRAAAAAHPDRGGSHEAAVKVNEAYALAQQELGL